MENTFKNSFDQYLDGIRSIMPVGKTFDLVERNITIGGRNTYMYFLNALTNSTVLQRILSDILTISRLRMERYADTEEFMERELTYTEVKSEEQLDKIITLILSGFTVLIIDGYEKAIVMDVRNYPVRSVAEPEKEKTLRGSKDGFVETLLFNTALIRRRIRDPKLIFELFNVGKRTKTDVAVGYIEGLADEKQVKKLTDKIKSLNIEALSIGDQSIVEALQKGGWFNPFPKVRYTQRPDVVSAHLTEGRFVIIVDNSPTVLLIPTCIFDFSQDVDDFYFPVITGNYFRMIRLLNVLVILFLPPVYLLIADGHIPLIDGFQFIIPNEDYAIPLFLQFLMLEIAVDALKLASLNTPDSLGMSLSVIGALILGEFSIAAGWFIPQTILCMAVVALASFTQPSIELGYAIKFMRIIMLIGAAVFGIWGVVVGLILNMILLAVTKSLTGMSYLYPLIPFNGQQLKRLIFRARS